jgi:hypothetical protein
VPPWTLIHPKPFAWAKLPFRLTGMSSEPFAVGIAPLVSDGLRLGRPSERADSVVLEDPDAISSVSFNSVNTGSRRRPINNAYGVVFARRVCFGCAAPSALTKDHSPRCARAKTSYACADPGCRYSSVGGLSREAVSHPGEL